MARLCLTALMLFWARLSWATVLPDTSYLFYRPLDYGSMSMVTPWNVVLNGSFDVLQLDGQDRRLGALAYANGATNVWHNIIRPGRAIDRLGFWKWVRTEVLPLDFTREGGQWLPNYQLHLIGGGMHYRLLKEWFHAHGVDAPGVWSAGTIAVYHVLNEVVENNAYRGANTDPIADLLLFDIAGPLLFSIDDVATFFARDLQMSDWSHIPVITLPEGRLGNNGLYYAMKWTLPGQDRWSLFYLMGMSNMAGASLKVDSEHSITMAVGARGRRLVDVDPTIHLKTLELVPTGGVFWDRNNSLLASLTASGQADQTIIAHVYPGLVRIGPLQPAFYASWGSSGSVGVGMALRATPGFGWRNR